MGRSLMNSAAVFNAWSTASRPCSNICCASSGLKLLRIFAAVPCPFGPCGSVAMGGTLRAANLGTGLAHGYPRLCGYGQGASWFQIHPEGQVVARRSRPRIVHDAAADHLHAGIDVR